MIELDERLTMLYDMVPPCVAAADIGADHGFLGARLLESGRCERVEFLDISEPSLKKAWRLIRRCALTERAQFTVGDGIAALENPADAIIVAGMGAPTISGIIERGLDRIGQARLIMQPNVGVDLLRTDLMHMGFTISDEMIVRAGGRFYVAIAAERGQASYTEKELLAGPVLLKKKPADFPGYVQFRLRVQRKAYAGAVKGESKNAEMLAHEIALWEEIEQCLQP